VKSDGQAKLKGAGKKRRRHERGPSVQVPRWRPGKKLSAWIKGYSIMALAESIRVDRRQIQRWLRGDAAPLRDNAAAMILLSQHCPKDVGSLTYEDIYGSPGDL